MANGMGKSETVRNLRRNHSFEETELRELQNLWPDSFKIEKQQRGAGRPSLVAVLGDADLKI